MTTNQTAATPAVPKDLRALVHDMGLWRQAAEAGVNLVIVSLAAALPEVKRTPELISQIGEGVTGIAEKRAGATYHVSPFDYAIMVKLTEDTLLAIVRDLKVDVLRSIERNFPGSFGSIDQSRLVLSYDLVANFRSAADRVAKYAELAQRQIGEPDADKQLRPLTTTDIKNVMRAYEKFGNERFVKAFVRNQDVVTNFAANPPNVVMSEYFISMDLLRKPLFVDVEMRGSGRLFNEFTLALDQILLQAFNHVHTSEARCSINLNVESVFTEVFEGFLRATPPSKLEQVVFEFRQANIVENFDEFQVARGLIKSKGAHIAVDQIFPQTVGLIDLDYIGASFAKIHWRNGAEEILKERERALKYIIDCNVTPILIRVDNARALEFGAFMGIELFQGFHIDSLLGKKPE